jgi:hypothetical protein
MSNSKTGEMRKLTGAQLIAQERQRQIEVEGYTEQHDAEHAEGELAMAAVCYAMLPCWRPAELAPIEWPWIGGGIRDGFKPTPNDRIRELVKAGALIAAEIDRLQNPTTP